MNPSTLAQPGLHHPHAPPLSDISSADTWDRALETPQFKTLMSMKLRCVLPLLGGSFAYLIAMTLLAGYAPAFMAQKIVGSFNMGYLLVLLTYLMCWMVSVRYVLTANRDFDTQADAVTRSLGAGSTR